MKKFKVYIPCNYVEGYLRSGHLEGVIEAESIEEVKQMSPEDLSDFCDIEVDNYRVEGYEADYDGIEIEEIKKDTTKEANKVKIKALKKLF